jgi:hypothetical protein
MADANVSLGYLREFLSRMHTDGKGPLPVVLVTPGGLIAGNAVPPAVWLNRMAEQTRTTIVATAALGAHESVARLFEGWVEQADPRTPDEVTDVYLVDAAVLPIESMPGANHMYAGLGCFQVSLDQVTAWTFGPTPE